MRYLLRLIPNISLFLQKKNDDLLSSQESNNEENNRDGEAENDLTPADMAEYLYATQRFPAFYAALERLVNQSKVGLL